MEIRRRWMKNATETEKNMRANLFCWIRFCIFFPFFTLLGCSSSSSSSNGDGVGIKKNYWQCPGEEREIEWEFIVWQTSRDRKHWTAEPGSREHMALPKKIYMEYVQQIVNSFFARTKRCRERERRKILPKKLMECAYHGGALPMMQSRQPQHPPAHNALTMHTSCNELLRLIWQTMNNNSNDGRKKTGRGRNGEGASERVCVGARCAKYKSNILRGKFHANFHY